jgi:hypothetical protein
MKDTKTKINDARTKALADLLYRLDRVRAEVVANAGTRTPRVDDLMLLASNVNGHILHIATELAQAEQMAHDIDESMRNFAATVPAKDVAQEDAEAYRLGGEARAKWRPTVKAKFPPNNPYADGTLNAQAWYNGFTGKPIDADISL